MKNPLLSIFLLLLGGTLSAAQLELAKDGKTDYSISPVENPTPIEELAVRELVTHLREISGCDFPVGASSGGRKIILERNAALAPQESEIRVESGNLHLAGGDESGVLYAVYALLENQFSCRWFTPVGDKRIPKRNPLTLPADLSYREKPVYPYRQLMCMSVFRHPEAPLFFLRNRMNLGMEMFGKALPAFQDSGLFLNGSASHTLLFYLPPYKGFNKPDWNWAKEEYFFKDHPEYYSMDAAGKRVTSLQLCFSNSEMRKEFTRRFFERVEATGARGTYSISAMDCAGKFCHCGNCLELEKKYRTPAGPLVDFLIEICGKAEKKYPNIRISTLCYRKEQSEKAPVLEPGQRLPGNLVLIFAPIDDDFSKTLNHSNNEGTRRNLSNWCKITSSTWVWYYPLPYGGCAPFGAVRRAAEDTRIFYECGANGAFYEHDVNVFNGLNFGDLMTYMMLRQFRSPNADYRRTVREYCDHLYGKAAPEVTAFLEEMDDFSEKYTQFHNWANGTLRNVFTPENMSRWNAMFDRMEDLTKDDPGSLENIRFLRIGFDITMLSTDYRNLRRLRPDEFPDPAVVEKRTRSAIDLLLRKRLPEPVKQFRDTVWYGKDLLSRVEAAVFDASVTPKELPEEFSKISPEKIRQVYPVRLNNCGFSKMEDAAFGQAIWDGKNGFGIPFRCGFYDFDGKRFLLNRKIKHEEMEIDRFHLYRLGEAPITPNCYVWMGGGWTAGVNLGKLWRPGEPNRKYELWISLKFEGKGYSPESRAEENKVWCDRVVVIEK